MVLAGLETLNGNESKWVSKSYALFSSLAKINMLGV